MYGLNLFQEFLRGPLRNSHIRVPTQNLPPRTADARSEELVLHAGTQSETDGGLRVRKSYSDLYESNQPV
jgi:hypothetical protein